MDATATLYKSVLLQGEVLIGVQCEPSTNRVRADQRSQPSRQSVLLATAVSNHIYSLMFLQII
jgi:hypothetical protein